MLKTCLWWEVYFTCCNFLLPGFFPIPVICFAYLKTTNRTIKFTKTRDRLVRVVDPGFSFSACGSFSQKW